MLLFRRAITEFVFNWFISDVYFALEPVLSFSKHYLWYKAYFVISFGVISMRLFQHSHEKLPYDGQVL